MLTNAELDAIRQITLSHLLREPGAVIEDIHALLAHIGELDALRAEHQQRADAVARALVDATKAPAGQR